MAIAFHACPLLFSGRHTHRSGRNQKPGVLRSASGAPSIVTEKLKLAGTGRFRSNNRDRRFESILLRQRVTANRCLVVAFGAAARMLSKVQLPTQSNRALAGMRGPAGSVLLGQADAIHDCADCGVQCWAQARPWSPTVRRERSKNQSALGPMRANHYAPSNLGSPQ